MCMVEDGEGWKVFREVVRRAAKAYRCNECRRTIASGETYSYATGLLNGFDGWETYRTCVHCRAASGWLVAACSGYLFGGVLEDLTEHWDNEPELRSGQLARLIAGMRQRWHDGRMPVPDGDAIVASIPSLARAT